jgi:hypothetical protein
MKIRIGSGKSAIEREVRLPPEVTSAHAFFAKAPLAARRMRVRNLIALQRRSRFRLIAGGLPAGGTPDRPDGGIA